MKLTDEQIIYALERCSLHKECCYCNAVEECGSKKVLTNSVLDLINRQKAEIGRLVETNKGLLKDLQTYHDIRIEDIKAAKSEAIKEFAKEHREIIMAFCDDDDQISLKVCEYDANTNNLVKEMVGENYV